MSKFQILFIDYWPDIDYLHACGAGLGSSLFKLAALADVSSLDYEVHLLTSPLKKELLEDALGIDFIYTQPITKKLSSFHKIINLGLTDAEIPNEIQSLDNFYTFTEQDKELYKTSPHIDFWRTFTARTLNYTIPKNPAEISICLESEELIKAVKLMPKQHKWIAISYQSISKLKDYPRWTEVIEKLLACDPKLHIVLLGDQTQETTSNDRVLNLMGKTDIQFLKAIISHVDLLVGVDGLATNIAMALSKKAVVLFTMISPENVIPENSKVKTCAIIAQGCPYQFCYEDLINYRNSDCRFLSENPNSKLAKCLEFNPNHIVDKVKSFLG